MVERTKLSHGLTDADWDGDAPAPGSSDKRYSAEAKRGFQMISDRIASQIKSGAIKKAQSGTADGHFDADDAFDVRSELPRAQKPSDRSLSQGRPLEDDEDEIEKVGWTDEARAASLEARRAGVQHGPTHGVESTTRGGKTYKEVDLSVHDDNGNLLGSIRSTVSDNYEGIPGQKYAETKKEVVRYGVRVPGQKAVYHSKLSQAKAYLATRVKSYNGD